MSATSSIKVSAIVRDAGGRVVGRTRLQKIAYLLSVAGLETGLSFAYRHYGPFSENIVVLARHEQSLGYLNEAEHSTNWGGCYSIYTSLISRSVEANSPRAKLASLAADADAVELELAATAIFLSKDGYEKPWTETARRKPEKAENGRLERAKILLSKLSAVVTPVPLPTLLDVESD